MDRRNVVGRQATGKEGILRMREQASLKFKVYPYYFQCHD